MLEENKAKGSAEKKEEGAVKKKKLAVVFHSQNSVNHKNHPLGGKFSDKAKKTREQEKKEEEKKSPNGRPLPPGTARVTPLKALNAIQKKQAEEEKRLEEERILKEEREREEARKKEAEEAAKKAREKVKRIQGLDRKLPLDDIATAEGLSFDELLSKIEEIVFSGTKLNIDYFLNDIYDEDKIDDIYDYFMNSHTDCIDEALKELDEDYTDEDIRLVRIKFISEMAN